jgi:hypothetical protein
MSIPIFYAFIDRYLKRRDDSADNT